MTSTIPTIHLTAFTAISTHSDADRVDTGQALVAALHRYGFARVTGHGLAKDDVDQAFRCNQKLFDLPFADKMKAPHPPGPFPHRGYSGTDQSAAPPSADAVGNPSRKMSDLRESYEVGSEEDDQQQNIWLPEETLPGFRTDAMSLYEKLAGIGSVLLSAISVGLGLDEREHGALEQLASRRHSQLRFLHYPAVSRARLQSGVFERLPAHNDWGSLTMLFQDENGGLELRDPQTEEFIHAEPEEGTLVLNIGDMLGRFTNDYLRSAVHQVVVPSPDTATDERGIPARRSIAFFVGPVPSYTVATLPRFVSPENPGRYDPVRFDEYGAVVSKYHYQVGNI
ncbi:hypothetical protein B0H67DRAFT_482120 [Lasiosphaeris hirsuta]|uniref:Fe2OG dioxygenase domain-containing protein n=1 Tax=Lasiosphaeris hirsuta TaxID=260670 RepID=A0AA40AYC3_9PEZI|nr:hypothetical protein B0H67DRAFT_482120 [Lasiosphaeris hirsuta]